MESTLNAPNILIAAFGALGILAIYWTLTMREKADLQRLRDDVEAGRVREEMPLFARLEMYLKQAQVDVSTGEFLRTAILLGLAVGAAAFILTEVWGLAILGFVVGASFYWSFLIERRDQKRAEFQTSLADVIALMIESFTTSQGLGAAFENIAKHGPPIVRKDFEWMLSQMSAGRRREEVLREWADMRRDDILDMIVETLLIQQEKGGNAEILLRGLYDSVESRVNIRLRIAAEQLAPKWEVRATALLIVGLTLFGRLTNPAYLTFWRTGFGGLTLIVAWGISLIGYYWANYIITSSSRVQESFGMVEARRTSAPPSARPKLEVAER